MAKRKSPDGPQPKDAKKKLSLKQSPIARKSSKSAGPTKSSSKLTTSPAIERQSAEQGRSTEKAFLIVGIGASAGGLEACTKLLEHLPPDTSMAFALVQHLAPTKKSSREPGSASLSSTG
jgi:chemotaxis response regulator CheB